MENKVGKFVYWASRILSIIFIAFLALFSLDVFTEGASTGQILLGLLIHNIPALILLAVLIISWKHEMVGAIAFILFGILYIMFSFGRASDWRMALVWSLQISGMSFLIGGLFLANWIKKRK